MQLNVSTDYAIRFMLYLARSTSKTVSSSKLSSAIGVSPRYLLKIGAKLRNGGFVTTSHGPLGGFGLAKSAKEISLQDVIIVMEETIKARPNSTPEQAAELPELSVLNAAYSYVDNVLCDIRKSITIENLLAQNIEEWYLAPCLLNCSNKTGEQS